MNDAQKQREQKWIDRAEKLETWDGWVYWEYCSHNNGFFSSVDEFLEYWKDEYTDDPPEWIYVCSVRHPMLDLDDILEPVIEDMWEDADCFDLEGVEELKKAIDAFNAANQNVNIYEGDTSRVVRVIAKEVA